MIAQRYKEESLPPRMSELILIVSDSTLTPMSSIGTPPCGIFERSLREHIHLLSQDWYCWHSQTEGRRQEAEKRVVCGWKLASSLSSVNNSTLNPMSRVHPLRGLLLGDPWRASPSLNGTIVSSHLWQNFGLTLTVIKIALWEKGGHPWNYDFLAGKLYQLKA